MTLDLFKKLDNLYNQGWEWNIRRNKSFGYRIVLRKEKKPINPQQPFLKFEVLSESFHESLESLIEKILEKYEYYMQSTIRK